jgi:glycosyltransferase involved in cell wall biosynthesis
MVGYQQIKNVIVITRANYPIGSWSNRVRLIAKGFLESGVNCKVLVTFPWPTHENIKSAENFVEFLTPPRIKSENIFSIVRQLFSLVTLIKTLYKIKEKADFILLTGDRFLDAYVVSHYCRKNDIKLYLDIVDEVGRAYDIGNKTIYAKLAIWNRNRFNNLLPRIDKIFVLSSYLEQKYTKLMKNDGHVFRSTPTFINEELSKQQMKDYSISTVMPGVCKSEAITIAYAGSCERTNGLFFFLDVLHDIIIEKAYNIKVFFLFHIGDIDVVRNHVRMLELENIISINHGVHPKYIPSLYDLSDILLLPEHGIEVANAGFPGKAGELLISGKAIITTNFSDLTTYFHNDINCMMAEIGDRATYKRNLIKLIVDPQKRKELGINAKKTGREYFDYISGSKIYLGNQALSEDK